MSRKKKEERKTQKGKFKNKLCFLAAAIAAGTITTEDKKLYGGYICTVRNNGTTTGNPINLGSAPGYNSIACGDGAIANGINSIATGKGAFTGTNSAIAIGENATTAREYDIAIGKNAGLYNQGKNAKNTVGVSNGYNITIGAHSMVGDDSSSVPAAQSIAIGGSGTQRDTGARKYGDSGGAWAKGDQSIAIGGDTIADGHSSIAIGGDDLDKAGVKTVTYTLATGTKTASLDTAMTDLTGTSTGYHQYNPTRSGAGAVALGVKAVSGDLSLAIGTMSKANKVNATAVGTGAVADLDNSVAIGGGATTVNAAGTQETSATINGVTYSNFAGGSGTKVGDVVSLGKNGTFNRQIKNVAAGNISATSTDAVNGSQLYSVAQTLQDRFKYVSINSTETGNADNKGALATNSIAIGPNASATVTSENAVVVGNGAKTTEQVMNPGAPTQWTKTGKNSVVIGNKASTNSEGSVAIGHEAKVDNTTNNSGSTIGRYKNDDNSTYMGTSLAQNNIYADPSYVGTQGIAIGANSYSDYQGMSMGVGARSKNLSLALGYFSNAEGTSSIATGVGAYAKGDNSISSGRQSSTISTGSVALGVAARGGSTADGGLGGSIAVGAASDATHEQAIAIGGITNANTATLEQGRGDNTQATAARATAIGANAKAQAESSIAFGTKANVGSTGTNAVAIGKDSSATVANGVALGSESKATTAAGVTGFDMADGRSNVYSGLAGTAKTANMAAVSVGDGANKTRQITGVAAGKEDTDAVNVAQLKSTNLKIAGNTTSGGADVRLHDQTLTVKGDGTYLTSTAAGNTITMELKQDVKDKIDNAATKKLDNLDPAGVQKIKDTAAWNVVANSGTAEKVQGGDTVKFIDGDNIEITQAGKDFTFATKKDVTFDSVTINNGPKLSSTGIDAGNKTISNVANGTANNDAVNLGQLNNAINNATATATSTEKVVASTAADNIATVAPSTGQNLGDKNATYEVSVSKTAVQNIAKDAAAWNVSTNGGTAEKVEGGDTVNFVNGDNIEVTNTGKDITIATKKDVTFDSVTINNGPKLSSTGVDAGNKKITNVADGTVGAGSKDAVNGGQLHDVKTSVTNNTTALNDLKSNTIKLSGDSTSTTAERLDKNGGIEFGVKSGDTNYLTSTATGTDVTLDLTQATKDKINNAATNKLDNLDPAGVQKIKDTAAWNVVANAGTAQKVEGGDTVKFLNGDNIEVTQAGKDFTFATKKDVTFDSVTINNGPKLSSTGIDAGNKKISNLADGTANNDAVNLGQLNNAINNATTTATSTEKVVASTAADNIATVAPSTGQNLGDKNATYEVSVSKTAVQNIAKDAAAWNVSTNGGAAEKVEGGDTVNFVNGDNIEVTNTGKDITIATKKDVTFDSVTINNGPKLSSTGVDAGNKKITNVADGTVGAGSKDAVNGGQLHDVKTSVTNNTTALNDLKSNTIKLSGDSTSTTAERLDKNGGIEFGVKSGDTNYLTSTAAGTDITLDLTSDTKAKIDKVTTLSNNTISLGGDTGTTNTQSLDKTGGIKFNVKGDGTYLTSNATNDDVTLDLTQATKDKINNAATNKLDNLDPAGVQKIKDTAAWNVVANSGTAQKVEGGDTVKFLNGNNIEVTQAGKDFTFATKKDVTFDSVTINNGPKLSSTGIDAGGKTISNVANGTANNDAVNLGQLNNAINNVAAGTLSTEKVVASTAADNIATVAPSTGQNLGDKNATYEVSVSKTAVQNIAKDAAAWNVSTNGGAAEKVEGGDTVNFVNGDNIEVTNTGKDITIATKKDATFDSVTINNGPKLSSTGVDAGNKKITNVADGTIGAGSKDAVNGGQLHDVKTSVTNNTTALNNLKNNTISLGGDTGTTNTQALDKNGGIKFNVKGDGTYLTSSATGDDVTLDLTQTTKDKINNAATNKLDNLDPTGVQKIKDTAAWNVVANAGTAEKVQGGDTVKFINGDNIEVTQAGKDFTFATKKDVTFDSVTINNGPKLSSTGVDAGNKKITNVADGTVGAGSKDAVNGGQLHDVKTSVTNNTTALNDLKSNTIKLSGDSTSTTAERLDKNGGIEFGVKSGDTNYLTSTAAGTDITLDLTSDTKAKIDKVTTLSNNTISLGGDTGTTNTQSLDKTGGIKFNVKGDGTYLTSSATGDDVTLDLTQTTKDKINNAATNKLDNLDPTGVQKIKDTAAWNVVANSGTAQKVQGGDTVKFLNGDNIEVTQAGKDFTFATKKDVTFDSVTINNGPKLSSTGIDAGGKTISNVANGTANNDAVNLGQLNNAINNVAAGTLSTEKVVASTAADNIATVAPSTGQNLGDKNATYEVSVSKTAVQNIAKDAAAWNVSTNGGAAEKVEGGDTVNFVNGDNIEVTNTGKDITIATKKDVTFDSVTINNGPKLSSTGVDAGNKKITNVADGTVGAGSKDAVNGGQLHDVKTSVTNNTTALNDLKSNTIKLSGDSTSTTAERLDKNGGIEFGVKSGDTNYLTSTATGTDITLDLTQDAKDKINKVTTLSSNTVSLGGDTGTTNTQALDKTGGIKFNVKGDGTYLTSTATGDDVKLDLTQATKDKINNAATNKLDNLDPAGVQKIKDTAAWNVSTNGGTAEKVEGGDTVNFVNGDNIEVTNTGKDITIATKRDATFDSVTINNGPKLSSTGVDAGNKKITNVADGTVGAGSKDAVNGGQLHDVKTSVTNNTTALNDLKSNTIKLSGDSTSTTAERLDKNGGIEFGVKSGDTNYLTSTAAGTDITLDLAQAAKDKINNAATNKLDNLDPTGVQKIKDTAAWNVVANSGTAEKVQGGDTVKFIDGDNIEITQAGKDFTFATKKDVTFDSVTINNGPKLSSTGVDAGNKKISNLADGTANNDAVNLGQLNNAINNATTTATSTEKVVASTAADNIATVAPSTGQNLGDKNATYEVSVSKTAVQNIAKDAAAWNVSTNGGTAEKVEGGDTVNFVNGDNIEVTNTGKDITIATKKDVTFDSVTINNGPKLSSTGVDAGNKKITNVADGTVGAGSKDAVNGGQLHDVKTSVTNNTTALNDLKSNTIKLSGDSTSTTAERLDKNGGIEFGVKSGDTNYLTSTAAGTDITLDLTSDTKAKIDKVTTLSNNTISLGGDTGTTNTQSLDKTGGIKFNVKGDGTYLTSNATNDDVTLDLTQATKDKINNAATNKLDNLDPAGVQKIKDTAAWNVVANAGTAEKVQGGDTVKFIDGDNIEITQAGKDFTFATKKDVTFDSVTINNGPKLSSTGIDAGNKKISNLADGTANNDAVNLGQLNTAINNAGAAATIKYKANGGTAETVRLSDGLDFVNGSNTTATVGPNGVVKYDVNLGTLAVGADGKAGADGKTGADGTVGKDGIATTQDVAKAINSSAWKVTSTASTGTVNTPSVEDVKNGDTVKFDAGDNIEITQNGKDFTFATKKDVKFDSVTINNGGPKLSATGIDAANKKITNVAAGDVTATSKDAVNGSQLYGLSKNTVTVSGDSTSTTPQTLDQTGGIKLGIKSGDTNFLTSTATGTDVTLDLTQDAKDKINKVTTLSSNTISLGGDTGTTNTQSLDKTGGIKFNVKGDGTYLTSNATNDDVTLDLTQATKDKINNAATNKLDNLDPAGIQKIKDTAAWNVVANNGTAEKVEGGNTVKFIDGDNIAITQAGKDFTIATKRDVNFDSVTVPAGAGNVVINNSGINSGNNKITNVADGTIAPGSKDAVNGGQLHDVQNTINAGTFTVSANGGAKDRIAKDENIDFENTDGNIAISYDATGNKFTYNLSPNLNLGPAGSLRIGDALLNNGGLTIVNGPSITSAGVDAGNKKVTNVADGTIAAGSKDAINGGQLHDVQTNLQTSINNNAQNIANNTNAINNLNTAVNNPITFTGDSGNNIDRKLGETLNIKGGATGNLTSGNIGVEADSATNTLNVKLAENIDLGTNGSVKMGDTKIDDNGLTINGGPSVTKAGIDAGNKKVTNVANGDITATSKDAVNGSQLHGVADSIKNSIGGNTILNPDGTITTNNIGGTGHNNIHDAIASVNNAANQRTTVVAGDNIDVTVSTNATGGNEYTVATKRDIVVDSVSVANNGPSMNSNGINAGGKTISNLGAGVNPNDAVNVAQLDAVKNSPITFGADTGTDHAATLGSRVSITGDNKNITTSISGNNIQVAMSDTPSFGTVNVNDANTGTITGASNVTLDNLDEDGTVGRVATEAQLAAVRNEVAGTKDIDNKLRGFKRGADAGTASAMAMAGIPQVINPGENAIGASISAYKQQTAVAVGYTRASKNGRAVLKISGSVNSNSELGFSLGFMKGWD